VPEASVSKIQRGTDRKRQQTPIVLDELHDLPRLIRVAPKKIRLKGLALRYGLAHGRVPVEAFVRACAEVCPRIVHRACKPMP
jgi:hypothetical protein